MKKTIRLLIILMFFGILAANAQNTTEAKRNITTEEWYETGVNLCLKQDDISAISAFTQAIKMNSKYVDAYIMRGLSFIGKGDRSIDWDMQEVLHQSMEEKNMMHIIFFKKEMLSMQKRESSF